MVEDLAFVFAKRGLGGLNPTNKLQLGVLASPSGDCYNARLLHGLGITACVSQ
jgi:hypothetical protein